MRNPEESMPNKMMYWTGRSLAGGRLAIAATALMLALGLAGPASADPTNGSFPVNLSLDCGGTTVGVVIQFSGTDAFHVVSDTRVFSIRRTVVTNPSTGQTYTIDTGYQGFDDHPLTACTYTGLRGSNITVYGFFTP